MQIDLTTTDAQLITMLRSDMERVSASRIAPEDAKNWSIGLLMTAVARICDQCWTLAFFDIPAKRPRPCQVAFLQRRPRFKHLSSRLGSHPSFISGHCVQGCLGGTSAYLLIGTVLDFASIDILKQFTVDIGDRRTFAGVHYPSDNLGSWYTAFKLLPHVIDSSVLPRARSFLWDAISTRSIVYRAIANYVHPDDGSSPYAPALAAIVATANPHLPRGS